MVLIKNRALLGSDDNFPIAMIIVPGLGDSDVRCHSLMKAEKATRDAKIGEAKKLAEQHSVAGSSHPAQEQVGEAKEKRGQAEAMLLLEKARLKVEADRLAKKEERKMRGGEKQRGMTWPSFLAIVEDSERAGQEEKLHRAWTDLLETARRDHGPFAPDHRFAVSGDKSAGPPGSASNSQAGGELGPPGSTTCTP